MPKSARLIWIVTAVFTFLTACTQSEDVNPLSTSPVEPTPPLNDESPDVPETPSPEPASPVPPDATPTEEAVNEDAPLSFGGTVPAPEFPAGLDWLNTERPLTLAELRGKIVLLDFWTYGCINCIHVMPELKRLEEKFADELVVIGVHSAKFTTEQETDNIRQIILRYELEHPVINDRDFQVWSTYGAQAWPTFVLIDPSGNVLGFHSGEGIFDLFNQVIIGMIAEFDALDLIDRTPLALKLERDGLPNSPLLFPGKVLADEANNRLFIADSNHHRIVITDLEGRVLDVIGNGRAQLQDGSYETAGFFRPQGMTLADDNTLYVADTENHAIRRVDLSSRLVETVAGTGVQGAYQAMAGLGPETALNSPWDVLAHEDAVYIAMAGQHQLWAYYPDTEQVAVYAGTGREELKDGPLDEGGLNQPSGLATDGDLLYFADSEASAIRTAGLPGSSSGLNTIVGAGLFEFGDVDGRGDEVRLQHPLGVIFDDGVLYVADTYNHKIKRIDPTTRESITLFGGDEDGWRDGSAALFDEPGGLSLGEERLYIADTNNHVIRIASLADGEVSTLVLVDENGLLTRLPEGELYTGKVVTLDAQTVSAGESSLQLSVTLPEGYKLNEIAPFSVELSGEGVDGGENGRFQSVAPTFPINLPLTLHESRTSLQADLVVYYCEAEAESLCLIEQVRLQLPLSVDDNGSNDLVISYTLPHPESDGP